MVGREGLTDGGQIGLRGAGICIALGHDGGWNQNADEQDDNGKHDEHLDEGEGGEAALPPLNGQRATSNEQLDTAS